MKIIGVKSTRNKALDMDISDNNKTNLVFCVTVDPIEYNQGKIYSNICEHLPNMSNKVNRYIYAIYLYDCNAILTPPMKNRSYIEMI